MRNVRDLRIFKDHIQIYTEIYVHDLGWSFGCLNSRNFFMASPHPDRLQMTKQTDLEVSYHIKFIKKYNTL